MIESLNQLLSHLSQWISPLVMLVVSIIFLFLMNYIFFVRKKIQPSENRLIKHFVMVLLTVAAIVAVILSLPIGDTARAQLLSLFGLLVTAAIALSSTTFVGNIMAGLMLRAVGNFKPGDFLRTGDIFGRVTERGLLHTEIQTEDRDLTTLPNLFLVTQPVKVIHSSGTIISAQVSLGYDVSRFHIEKALLKAAQSIGLQDSFVQVIELGDFSVAYRVAGFFADVKFLLTTQSKLRAAILDELHHQGIEIVSPNFMNQRVLPVDQKFIPKAQYIKDSVLTHAPEDMIFDKAEQAESLEKVKERLREIAHNLEQLKENQHHDLDQSAKNKIDLQIESLQNEQNRLILILENSSEKSSRD